MQKISLNNKKTHRYFAPKKHREISEKFLKYSHAEKLAEDIDFNKHSRYFVFINGTFFFGDFIEAFIVKNNFHVKKMTISSLSMNKNNIDSLANLINGDFVNELNLIISDYFYGHEKHDLVPYIYKTLDIEDKFQCAFAGTHCKLCIFELFTGEKYVFHGSANLRSSSNIEQICLEKNNELYLWMDSIQNEIIETYKTINKSVRGKQLWQSLERVGDVQVGLLHQEREEEIHKEIKVELISTGKEFKTHRFKKIKF